MTKEFAEQAVNNFTSLAAINVNDHVEKKAGLSYLSWPWAVGKLMENDPSANWEFHAPQMFGESMMVSCTVTAFGKPITMHLPVMDHRNKAISNPDAFEVNKNMMRCLVKAIACHGLGLYIYAGEDLPEQEKVAFDVVPFLQDIESARTVDELKVKYSIAYKAATDAKDKDAQAAVIKVKDRVKSAIAAADSVVGQA